MTVKKKYLFNVYLQCTTSDSNILFVPPIALFLLKQSSRRQDVPGKINLFASVSNFCGCTLRCLVDSSEQDYRGWESFYQWRP